MIARGKKQILMLTFSKLKAQGRKVFGLCRLDSEVRAGTREDKNSGAI